MLRHQDVAEDIKLVSLTDGFEIFKEGGSCFVGVEVGEPPITTEGDEVIVAFSLESLQVARHEGIVTPETCGPHPSAIGLRMDGAPMMGLWLGHPDLWLGHPSDFP